LGLLLFLLFATFLETIGSAKISINEKPLFIKNSVNISHILIVKPLKDGLPTNIHNIPHFLRIFE